MSSVIIDHPLIQHKLSILRSIDTTSQQFRNLVEEISLIMGYEISREFALEPVQVKTPLETTTAQRLKGKKPVLLPILRAGLGMVEGMRRMMPAARIGHIGIYRNEETLEPNLYFFKIPTEPEKRHFIVLDPTLATGGSAIFAVSKLKEIKVMSITMASIVASPEGVHNFHTAHPEVKLFTASIDRELNNKGYILPGLGDAGDRIFGTR